MRIPEQYSSAERLEAYLGDPANPANALSFERMIELDERDEYPEEACALLDRWGFAEYYVPARHGGKLRSFEEFLSLWRVLARRDLTVAIAHAKTFLGTIPVWVGGSEQQQERLARRVKNNEQISLALTERAHGSDLVASEMRAEPGADGYLLSGEKWLINNATRSTALTIFARTNPAGGSRGSSLFLVEKGELDERRYLHLPRVKTHGIRGADISGIRFDACPIPAGSLIGSPGAGLELTLKILQLTRSMCAGLSLGAGDTALRIALDFALARKLYGDTVFAIPQARSVLVDAFLDLMICECVAIAATRSIHVAPGQMSVWSAVVKYFVPTTIEHAIRELGVVLGARHYLREGHRASVFQKIARDNAIVSLFDGSTVVNLQVIAQQLRHLAERRARPDECAGEHLRGRLQAIFTLEQPLADFDPRRLDLFNRGYDDIVQGIALHDLREEAGDEGTALEQIRALSGELRAAIEAQDRLRADGEREYGSEFGKSPELFELAKQHCVLHAAAACIHMWRYNRLDRGPFFARGEWLALCLDRLLRTLNPVRRPFPRTYADNVAQELIRTHTEGRLFSIIPLRLG